MECYSISIECMHLSTRKYVTMAGRGRGGAGQGTDLRRLGAGFAGMGAHARADRSHGERSLAAEMPALHNEAKLS